MDLSSTMASSFVRHYAHMSAALIYGELSSARRKRVGAVLVRDDRIISIGYNGTLSGMSNVCELPNGETDQEAVVHAEVNVIAFAARNGIATDNTTLYITLSPCFNCSKLLVQAGVKEVRYNIQHSVVGGIKLLKEAGIVVKQQQV
jgi:dCMP deaminase